MSIRKKSIAIFAIIYFALNTTNAEERIVYRKHLDFPSGFELFFNPRAYRLSDEYHNLTYVLCDNRDDLQKSERNCTAVQDTQPERSCPVTLTNFKAGDDLEIFPFGSTRAVIFWSKPYTVSEKSTIKCMILDFNTCKSKDVLLEESIDRIHWTYFAAYDDSFDLVTISNTDQNAHNKYHVDLDGNVIFTPWKNPETLQLTATMAYRAIVADSKLKAYLHFGLSFSTDNFSSIVISLIKPDGWRKLLAVYSKHSNTGFMRIQSTAHETIGVAFAVDNSVEVWQFDLDGKLKLNTSVSYDIDVDNLALGNLADGGFLLFTTGSRYTDAYYLTKVDADGKVATIKKEPEPNCKYKTLTIQLFDNEAKEYCIVIVCNDNAQVDLVVKCVSDEDFSKSKSLV